MKFSTISYENLPPYLINGLFIIKAFVIKPSNAILKMSEFFQIAPKKVNN